MKEQIFTPADTLNFATVPKESLRLRKLLASKRIEVLNFDLRHVKYCDSAGLALLIDTKRLCREFKTNLNIQGESQAIRALSEFCGVAAVLENSNPLNYEI